MKGMKRAFAVVLVAVSILGLILCAAGVIATWSVSNALTNAAARVLTLAEVPLDTVEQGTAAFANEVQKIRDVLATIDQAVTEAGDQLNNSTPVLDLIDNAVGEQLGSTIDGLREKLATLRDAVVGVNHTLEALNSIPGVSVPTLTDELQTISIRLESIKTGAQEFAAYVSQVKADVIEAVVTAVTSRTAKIDDALATLHNAASDLGAAAANGQADIATLQTSIPAQLNLAATIITLILILFAAGQVGLILHGRRLWVSAAAPKPDTPAVTAASVSPAASGSGDEAANREPVT